MIEPLLVETGLAPPKYLGLACKGRRGQASSESLKRKAAAAVDKFKDIR